MTDLEAGLDDRSMLLSWFTHACHQWSKCYQQNILCGLQKGIRIIHVKLLVQCCCCSITKSCLILCDPMDCSMPGFPVLHYLLEFAQPRVHCVDYTTQPSHPLSFLSPPVLHLPSIRVFSNESALHIWWPEYWGFSFSISPSNSGLISFRTDWFDLLDVSAEHTANAQ